MTVPNFLASSFYFSTSAPITDVATIITDVRTILTTTNNPVWTEPVAGTFQSPVDSAGRFMRVTLVKNTATRLTCTLQDQNLLTIFSREFDIPATAEVSYFSGQYHFILEAQNGTAVADHLYCFMIDPSPYALNASQNYVLGNAYRNTSAAIDGAGTSMDQFFMLEAGASTQRQRARGVGQTVAVGGVGLNDFQGNPQIFPFDIYTLTSAGSAGWGGKLYQTYMVPNSVGAGVIKKIALDDGTLASFKVLMATATNATLMAVRVA